MTPKEIVLEFYKPDVLLDRNAVNELIHPEITIDWNSSKGFIQMNHADILALTDDLHKAYTRSKMRISHAIEEGNLVSVLYKSAA